MSGHPFNAENYSRASEESDEKEQRALFDKLENLQKNSFSEPLNFPHVIPNYPDDQNEESDSLSEQEYLKDFEEAIPQEEPQEHTPREESEEDKVSESFPKSEPQFESDFENSPEPQEEELLNEDAIKKMINSALKDSFLESYSADCLDYVKELCFEHLKYVTSSLIQISRRRQSWNNLGVRSSSRLPSHYRTYTQKYDEEPVEIGKLSLLEIMSVRRSVNLVEQMASNLESEKRIANLAKLKKEEETKGKARRNGKRDPSFQALKERVEKEKKERESNVNTENTKNTIKTFLEPGGGYKRKRQEIVHEESERDPRRSKKEDSNYNIIWSNFFSHMHF